MQSRQSDSRYGPADILRKSIDRRSGRLRVESVSDVPKSNPKCKRYECNSSMGPPTLPDRPRVVPWRVESLPGAILMNCVVVSPHGLIPFPQRDDQLLSSRLGP